jgi:hypothetical protein
MGIDSGADSARDCDPFLGSAAWPTTAGCGLRFPQTEAGEFTAIAVRLRPHISRCIRKDAYK